MLNELMMSGQAEKNINPNGLFSNDILKFIVKENDSQAANKPILSKAVNSRASFVHELASVAGITFSLAQKLAVGDVELPVEIEITGKKM